MYPPIRMILAPLTSLILLIMASGLFNTFIPIRLEIEGYSPEMIGIVTSTLSIGILIGSLQIDRVILKIGHVRSLILFAMSSCILVIAQGFWINPWYWMLLRVMGGGCMAGIFIAIESWLLLKGTKSNRGVILSIYLGVFYGALMLGQFLIHLSDPAGPRLFWITALLCILSILPLLLNHTLEPKIQKTNRMNIYELFRTSPLGFMGGIISGMLLASIYGLVPVYAKEIGLSIAEISNFMAMIIFGGLCLQWPIGRWADKYNRRKTLYIVSFLSAFFSLAITYIHPTSLIYLFFFSWAFGGFAFTLYPLSMSYTCESLQEEQIIAATGGFVLSYSIGAIAGPLVAPFAMNYLGHGGLFYFFALICLALGLFGLKRPKLNILMGDANIESGKE